MNAHDIRLLYAYNRWANALTLDAASALTPEQFTKDLACSHRSVRDTLAHILGAEWIWLMRREGTSPKELLDPADFPDHDSLRARWAEVEREQAGFIEGVSDGAHAASGTSPSATSCSLRPREG